MQLAPELPQFCARLHAMYEYSRPTGLLGSHWTDERTALAYDAAKLVLEAVDHTNQHNPPNLPELIAWIKSPARPEKPGNLDVRPDQALNDGLVDPRAGTTGSVDFRATQIADAKQLAILRADLAQADPYAGAWASCFVLSGDPPTATDCLINSVTLPATLPGI